MHDDNQQSTFASPPGKPWIHYGHATSKPVAYSTDVRETLDKKMLRQKAGWASGLCGLKKPTSAGSAQG